MFVYNHLFVAKSGLQNSNGLFIICIRNGKTCNCLRSGFLQEKVEIIKLVNSR